MAKEWTYEPTFTGRAVARPHAVAGPGAVARPLPRPAPGFPSLRRPVSGATTAGAVPRALPAAPSVAVRVLAVPRMAATGHAAPMDRAAAARDHLRPARPHGGAPVVAAHRRHALHRGVLPGGHG